MSFTSRARTRRAAPLLATLIVAFAFVFTVRNGEAHGAPNWLSKFVRAVTRREAVSPITNDTVVVFGPKILSLGAATSGTFVERFTVATPTIGAYLLRVTNGPGGASGITGGSIKLNGATVLAGTDLAALGATGTRDIPVIVAATDTIVATLSGPTGAAVSVSLLTTPDARFTVFGPRQYERSNGVPFLVTSTFTLPAGAKPPAFLCIRNGELDGSRRNSSSRVILNGVEIVGPADLNQQVAGFLRPVTFQPTNTIQVEMNGAPGSRLTLCALATDSLAPRLTITAPVPSLITRQPSIDAVGVVVEQTAVKITVNGQLASVTPGTAGQTSFTARVPLATEGSNTIAFSAIDAAGNRTDSTRTVIRDTQAPLVTLNSLPDSATVRADSSLLVTGTIIDATAVTGNVNGQPLAIDSASHTFSQRITLASGMNFITITATDAAGNATSVVRQITVDATPPTLTVTGPAEALVTKELVAHVMGTASASSAVSVTVNGAAVALGSAGAFAKDVAITEGANTLTVVATNAAGLSVTATRHVIRDTEAPSLGWSAPVDSAITKDNSLAVTGTITDATTTSLTVNGTNVPVNATTKAYATTLPLLSDGEASVTLVATDAAGNVTTATRTVTRDATAPVITVQSPDSGTVTQSATVAVSGSVRDLTTSTLTVNGTTFPIATDGGFSGTVGVTAGANTLTFVARDAAGNETQQTRTLTRDNDAPVIQMASPSDQVLVKTATVTVSGSITDASVVTATLNGAPLTIASDRTYQSTIALSEGMNTITLVATDAAGNATTVTRSVTLDMTAPVLIVSAPADAITVPDDNITVSGTATDQSALRVTVNGAAATLSGSGAFSTSIALATGSNAIAVIATDSVGNSTTVTRSVTKQPAVDPNLPPNPRTVAPALNRTVVTTQAAATAFLYSGSNPIQTGVAPTTIVAARASTLRGRVLNAAGAALPGASVTVLDHPEFGGTKSRADGWYDLVVNGGGKVTLAFAKDGYIGAQRVATAPRQDYGKVDDVSLLKPDTAVTVVQLGATSAVQIARSSTQTDADGPRQATFIFDAGTTATIRLPNGTTQPAPALSIRLTEFTVGENGRARMPASLPPASGYTYAVEPTADEAVAVGGQVTFSKPVSAYVENFLEFPVGTKLPLGIYDRTVANWIPQPDGRVIKVVSVANGIADVDVNGDGVADSDATLTAMGFSTAERQQIATSYPAGAQLMRTRLFGLYPFDANLPFKVLGSDPVVTPQPSCASATRDIIKCDVRVASQAVNIPGTPLTLAYTSARAAGAAERSLHIPITGTVMPAGLRGAYVRVWVAGQMTEQQYLPAANLSFEYTWDGNDAYGRPVQGNPSATVEIGHLMPVQYQVAATTAQSFGMSCDGTVVNGQTFCDLMPGTAEFTERHSFWRTSTQITKLGGLDAKAQGLGGFDFNVHHQYDPVGRVLYLGDGTTRVADAITPVMTTVAGKGLCGTAVDGVAATKSCLIYPAGALSVVAMPDGGFLVPDQWQVRRVRPDGIIERFAGLNQSPTDFQTGNDRSHRPDGTIVGEGGPATQSYVNSPGAISVAPDGTVYIADGSFPHIVRVAPTGILTRVIGKESGPQAADGMPANVAKIDQVRAMTAGLDGALFFVSRNDPNRIYRLGADSVLHVIAGTGIGGATGDGGPARQARIGDVTSLAVGVDGSLYFGQDDIYTASARRVRRITPDGVITTVAGGGGQGADQATPALQFGFGRLAAIAVSADGTVYAANDDQIEQVSVDGVVRRFAGENLFNQGQKANRFGGDGGAAQRAWLNTVTGMSVTADGAVLIADYRNGRIRKVAAAMPGFSGGALVVPAENGRAFYLFDASGRHLKTVDRDSKATLFTFEYDSFHLLTGLRDREGDLTRVERDATGKAVALIASTGQRTTLTVDVAGQLTALTGPDGFPLVFAFDANGLLTGTTNQSGRTTSVAYDATGRVTGIGAEDGGLSTVSLVPLPAGQRADFRSASGTQVSLTVDRLPNGDQVSIATLPDGRRAQLTNGANGSTSLLLPDGTSATVVPRADPITGIQAAVYDATVSIPTPAGIRTKVIHTAAALMENVDGEIVLETDSTVVNGRATVVIQNHQAGTITTTSAAGRVTTSQVDALGRITRDSTAGLVATEYTYDEHGRVTAETRGSQVWQFVHDSAGRVVSQTSPSGRITNFRHDAADRVVAKVAPGGDSTTVAYDAEGLLIGVGPSGRGVHTFTHTATGRIDTYLPPAVPGAGGPTKYAYDLDGRTTSVVRAGGDTIAVGYDALGQLSTLRTIDGSYQFAYDAAGRIRQSASPLGSTVDYEFAGGLPTRTAWSGSVAGVVSATYDNDFRPLTQSVAGSNSTTFAYDDDGFLVATGSLLIGRNPSNGLPVTTSLGALTTSTTYDAYGATAQQAAAFNGAPLFANALTRDAHSRITVRQEVVQGEAVRWEYAYDTTSRLSTVRRDGAVVATYEYGVNGNRVRSTGPAGISVASTDAQDRLLTNGLASFGYTANGDLAFKAIGSDTTRYRYTTMGALAEVKLPDGTRIEHVIDAEGHRVGKKVNGTLVKGWLYDGELAIAAEVGPTAVSGSNQVTSRFVFGESTNVPEYMIRGAQTYRIIVDERGSVRLVVDAGTGAVTQRLDYDEFGRVTRNTNPGFQPFGFAGGLYDEATGLVRFGARDYDAETGRFTTKDPVRFSSGDGNQYGYGFGDPINWVDPTGLTSLNEEEGVATIQGQLAQTRVPTQLFHKLVRQGTCFVVQQGVEQIATDILLGGIEHVIYDTRLQNGARYVGRTVQKLSVRIGRHLRRNKQITRLLRVIIADASEISLADAEATVLDDVLRRQNVSTIKEGLDAGKTANIVKPSGGVSRLCP